MTAADETVVLCCVWEKKVQCGKDEDLCVRVCVCACVGEKLRTKRRGQPLLSIFFIPWRGARDV